MKNSYLFPQVQLTTTLLGSLTQPLRGSQDSLLCAPHGMHQGSMKRWVWKGRTIKRGPLLTPLRLCPLEDPWTSNASVLSHHIKNHIGTSLVAQWLRLHSLNAGGPGWIPGQGTRSHMPQLKVSAYPN